MTNGPIEFLGDAEGVHEVPPTEFGGSDGLIQPEDNPRGAEAADGMRLGHDLTASETAQVMARRANVALSSREAWTGVADEEDVVDPATGRVVSAADAGQDVTGKAGREHKLSDGMWQ